MRRWQRPIHDFLMPYMRGAEERLSDQIYIPQEVQRRRDLNTRLFILPHTKTSRARARPRTLRRSMPRLLLALSYSRVIYKLKWVFLHGGLRFLGAQALSDSRHPPTLYMEGFCALLPDDCYRPRIHHLDAGGLRIWLYIWLRRFSQPPAATKTSPQRPRN